MLDLTGSRWSLLTLLVALVTAAVLAILPTSSTASCESVAGGTETCTTGSESLLQSEGASVLVVLAIPAIVASAAVVFPKRGVAIATAVVLSVMTLLGAASLGLFFIPHHGLGLVRGSSTSEPAERDRQPKPDPKTQSSVSKSRTFNFAARYSQNMADDSSRSGEKEELAGRVTEFLRIGDTVRRPATESTESMRRLLIHLERSGFEGAPRVVRSESDGSIVLTWVHGWVPTDTEGWRLDLDAVASVGEMLRAYHDCAVGFVATTGFEEGPQVVDDGRIVCHGDIAPRNTVFRDGRALAFIDWDGIWAASPLWDLGHAVWQFTPVCDDKDPWIREWPDTPDRSARIAALVRGYRLDHSQAQELAEMVVEVVAGVGRSAARKATAGIPPSCRCNAKACSNPSTTSAAPPSSCSLSSSKPRSKASPRDHCCFCRSPCGYHFFSRVSTRAHSQ